MNTGDYIQIIIAIIMLIAVGISLWAVLTSRKSVEIAKKDRRDDFLPILMIDRTRGNNGIEKDRSNKALWHIMFRNYGKGPAHSIESDVTFIKEFSERQLPPCSNYLVVKVDSYKMKAGENTIAIRYKDVFNEYIVVKYGLLNDEERRVVLLHQNQKMVFEGLPDKDT